MTKIAPAKVEGFLRRPSPDIAAVLLFGPDRGLVRERAQRIVETVVEDPRGPFAVVEMTAADILADPPRLGDAAAQMSIAGGRQAVCVRDATDGTAKIFAAFLDAAGPGNLVIAEAGNLAKGSSLRTLFEKAGNAAAVGCYVDGARELGAVIAETLARFGAVASADARSFLVDNLGGDRLITRNELEKLAIFAGGREGAENGSVTIGLEDAIACVGDSAAVSLDSVAFAGGGGDTAALERTFERALTEGATPIAALRAVQRHLQRLHLAGAMVAQGKSAKAAMAALRPKVFFLFESQFRDQLSHWRSEQLAAALDLLSEAEMECKTTAYPAKAGCHRALMRVAQAARAGRRAA